MLNFIEVITKDNKLTGELSTPEDATNRGLWHRGAHAIIMTPSGNVLVQKRPDDAIQHPGMVDVGVGGFVDKGETPEQTIIREIKEETGFTITQDQLLFLGTSKYNHHWYYGTRRKISRAIIYSYAARLDQDVNHVTAQPGEVAWVGFIPLKSAQWLIHKGSLKRIGKLVPTIAYYRRIIRQTTRYIRVKKA